jgi:spermidine synthase
MARVEETVAQEPDEGSGGGVAAAIRRLRAWLPRRGAAADGEARAAGAQARKPFVRRRWRTTELQFVHGVSQSRMLTADPDRLLIDYTRTMLGALALAPEPGAIGIVGLGGGSQAKFCRLEFPRARIEAIENNPHVVALRRRFRIPEDDERFGVVLDDAAVVLRRRRGVYDLLLVDAYDETGIPAALATADWYADCAGALAAGGAAGFNLYCDDVDRHLALLREVFDGRVLVLAEPRQSNRVAIGWRGARFPEPQAPALSPWARGQLAPALAKVSAALRARRAMD